MNNALAETSTSSVLETVAEEDDGDGNGNTGAGASAEEATSAEETRAPPQTAEI